METEIAPIASVLVLTTMYMVIAEARRIHNRFYLAPDEHVTFEELRDIFPATRGEGAATPGAESAATAAGKVAATASCRTPSPAAMRQSKSFSTPTGKERGE